MSAASASGDNSMVDIVGSGTLMGARPEVRAPAEKIDGARVRAIFVGSMGNLVEWYDFYCYAAFSLYFASSFFPAPARSWPSINASDFK